jgi:hypothetical protein
VNYDGGRPDPWRALAAGILERAIVDLKAGKEHGRDTCNGVCRCAASARRFLVGPWAGYLFDVLDVDKARALAALGLAERD